MRFHGRCGWGFRGCYQVCSLFYEGMAIPIVIYVVFLSGCASGPTKQTDQFDRADDIQRSLESSAAARVYGTEH